VCVLATWQLVSHKLSPQYVDTGEAENSGATDRASRGDAAEPSAAAAASASRRSFIEQLGRASFATRGRLSVWSIVSINFDVD